jgi:hypothetical protein
MFKVEMKDGYLLQKLSGAITIEEINKFIEESKKIVRNPNNQIKILNDYRESYLNESGVKEIVKEWVDGNEPFVKKAAVLGIVGIKKIFFNVICMGKKHIKPFDDEKEAIAWLLQD